MSEELKGSISDGKTDGTVEQDIDPELRDDRDEVAGEEFPFELPEYDETQFEFPDDEFEGEDGDEA